MTRDQLLRQIKETLQETYGDRLQGVVLYGSEARGEAQEDSDIDLMVLLKGPVDLGDDLQTIIKVLYPLQLEILGTSEYPQNRLLDAVPVDVKVFEAGEYAVYRSAKKEGILL